MKYVLSAIAASIGMTAAFVAAPATASAADTTPYVQLVVSHVRFVSFVGVPQDATNTAFDTAVWAQQPYDNAQDEGESGGGRVPLTRTYPSYDYEDHNFTHGAQFVFSQNKYQWGTRLSRAWQAVATGPVVERTFWYVNGGRAEGGGHTPQPAYYQFHGSFAARPGDTIDMASEFTFPCGDDKECRGTLYSSYYIAG